MTTTGPVQLELSLDMPAPQLNARRWLRWAALDWQAFHGREMTIRWARDLALIKPLLRQHGPEELAARWRAYVRTVDQYLARRGWDVPTFSTAIDRFAGTADRVELARLWNDRHPPARDRLTGAVIESTRRR